MKKDQLYLPVGIGGIVAGVVGAILMALGQLTVEQCASVVVASAASGTCTLRTILYEAGNGLVYLGTALLVGAFVLFATRADDAPAEASTKGRPAAGWYPDPTGRSGVRWWDGARWGEPQGGAQPIPEVKPPDWAN